MDGMTPAKGRRFSISSMVAIALAGLQGICAIIILGLVGVRFGRTSFSAAVSALVVPVYHGQNPSIYGRHDRLGHVPSKLRIR